MILALLHLRFIEYMGHRCLSRRVGTSFPILTILMLLSIFRVRLVKYQMKYSVLNLLSLYYWVASTILFMSHNKCICMGKTWCKVMFTIFRLEIRKHSMNAKSLTTTEYNTVWKRKYSNILLIRENPYFINFNRIGIDDLSCVVYLFFTVQHKIILIGKPA